MAKPSFTLADFQLFARYQQSANYGTLPEEEKAHFASLRDRVKQVLADAVSLEPRLADC
jgi:hypothetical protein